MADRRFSQDSLSQFSLRFRLKGVIILPKLWPKN